ncbi:MAG: SlyX family protein [Pseudomonadales bacterium]|nr:SlyX family protein [Pseudomonadales bacterium]HAO54363.1 hypothetical protein [Gammaproteobacteria bacterium]|tara:strand:+ start:344 stop:556 length:213 start_codon:yes stop_codon:yes gene_type:complete
MSNTELVSRINDLESQLAFQEDTINELNEVIVQFQRRMDKLNSTVNLLIEQVQSSTEINPSSVEPKPPHY